MKKLKYEIDQWEQNGFPVKVVDAPKDAVTFDKLIVVFNELGKIRTVSFYNSKQDKIVSTY